MLEQIITTVLPSIRSTLDPAPLYTQRRQLNAERPDPPYGLLLVISQPADPNVFDSVLLFGLEYWDTEWGVLAMADELEWLNEHHIFSVANGAAQNVRYRRQGRVMTPEPEITMPDGTTEVWHLSDSYRVQFANFAALL